MVYPNGKVETKPKGIANVFRQFYEDLYTSKESSKSKSNSTFHVTNKAKLHKLTFNDVNKAFKQLKNGKCKDTKYVTAEIIKHAGVKTNKLIANFCNDVLNGFEIPKSWHRNTINVLHKTGPTQDASNYRPNCILDITYKVLARILYNRIIGSIDSAQSVDQAGFRK